MSKRTGGIDGRPARDYMASKRGDIEERIASACALIRRRGCVVGMRASMFRGKRMVAWLGVDPRIVAPSIEGCDAVTTNQNRSRGAVEFFNDLLEPVPTRRG